MSDSERLVSIEKKLDTLIEIVRGFNTRLTELENVRTTELRGATTHPAPPPNGE